MSETKSGSLIHEGWLLGVLAAIQFTAVLDFMIIMPLGPQYMRVFQINPSQFGLIVSAYAIAAGISGIIAGFFLDRFDRKRAMLVLYAGFTFGTLFCAMAPTYPTLVAARVVAGAFGGVTMGLVMAVIGDVIPEARRGRAMALSCRPFQSLPFAACRSVYIWPIKWIGTFRFTRWPGYAFSCCSPSPKSC